MKKSFKISVVLLALILSLSLMSGCSLKSEEAAEEPVEKEAVLPEETPEEICEMRDSAMEDIQEIATENEGLFTEKITALVAAAYEDTKSSTEYTSLQETLELAKDKYDADKIFVAVKDEDGNYVKTVSTEKKAKWLEECDFSDYVKENVEAGLITSAKCGADDLWPVYAPMYDQVGNLTAVICMEVPFDLSSYPEWDKNSDSWHGIE